jgi:hypothetical protein
MDCAPSSTWRNMASESLSPQEANELLHKFITESSRVQGSFVSPVSGGRALLWGAIRVCSTGLLNIVEREDDTTSPIIGFDESRAVLRKYGEERPIKKIPQWLSSLSSNLGF